MVKFLLKQFESRQFCGIVINGNVTSSLPMFSIFILFNSQPNLPKKQFLFSFGDMEPVISKIAVVLLAILNFYDRLFC